MLNVLPVVILVCLIRLGKCHHPHHPGWCKIFRVWVKFGTEHTVFCRKLNLFVTIFALLEDKSSRTYREYYFYVYFNKLLLYFKGILMI